MLARLCIVAALIFADLICESAAVAEVTTSNLNFATVNQNLWGPGSASVIDESITLPPPTGLSGSLSPGDFKDPASAVASFLGFDVGVSIAPTASFNAALSASFHANTGSIDLNYPTTIELTLPNQVQAGQSFTVSATPPGPVSLSTLAKTQIAAVVGAAGAGYSSGGLSQFLIPDLASGFQPVAGFSTVFPYAEAKVNLDLAAAGQITSKACLIFCVDGPTIKLGSIDLSQQIFELSTLNGLKVLDQTVVPFNQTIPIAQGVSIAFSSPNVSVDGTLRPDKSLMGSDQKSFLDFSFNVDQLIPFVGQILQSNIGPVGYDLLSVTPDISLGIKQEITFDPKLMVDLQFASPVYDNRDGKLKNDVVFQVGDSVNLTPTVGGALGGGSLLAKPTFFLDNTIHNTTTLVLNGTLDVQALKLDVGATLGPFFDSGPIDLGSIPLLDLDDQSWTLAIPPITGQAQTIARTGLGLGAQALNYQFTADGTGQTNSQGHLRYQVSAAGNQLGLAFGQIVQTGGLSCFREIFDPHCQTLFIADDDLFGPNQEPLGRMFCIQCNDLSPLFLDASPFLADDASGEKLLLSDLTSFPQLIDLEQLLDPMSPLYDTQLATSQYFADVSSTPAALVRETVPEPGSLLLALTAVFALSFCSRMSGNLSAACTAADRA